jgi:ribosomal protein S18 acetylase RimI-like enzyme
MHVTIREAVLQDEAGVTDLWRACGLIASYNDPGIDFRFAISNVGSAVLVAVDAAECIVGSAMVGHDGHRGWLYYVASAPEWRGQGIGRAVIDAAEQWLGQQGVAKVQLMIRETNSAVMHFYERLGYEDMPRVLMSKWLKQP